MEQIKDKPINTLIGPVKTKLGYSLVWVQKITPVHEEPYEKVKGLFMTQAFQEESERLAKEAIKDKEYKFEFADKK